MNIRRATLDDLSFLVEFASEEAIEAENLAKDQETLTIGIRTALEDPGIAIYWVLVNDKGTPVGNVSALKEWSNWNAGFYWWIQSMYIKPEYRGKGWLKKLIEVVEAEMQTQNGLELKLQVHKANAIAQKAYLKAGFEVSNYDIMNLVNK